MDVDGTAALTHSKPANEWGTPAQGIHILPLGVFDTRFRGDLYSASNLVSEDRLCRNAHQPFSCLLPGLS